ncbi:MAG: hypothetical protein J6I42_03620 [Clostridia bacterium]|nr:hypothetical protein [Oscillospiraceae bacterium]MBO4931250.1 hypothetical protein [Clostridia bacterium]
MKEFWSENSKIISKLILNQFGATFLGLMVIAAASAAQGQRAWLMLFASCFAAFFYLFLVYAVVWERGGRDRIKVDGGRAVPKPWTGLWISLIANIPNFILAILVLISDPFKASFEWAGNMNLISRALCLLWEGMYAGFVSYFSPNNPLIHLLYVFPAIAVSVFGYLLGFHNLRLLSVFELKPPKNQQNSNVRPNMGMDVGKRKK